MKNKYILYLIHKIESSLPSNIVEELHLIRSSYYFSFKKENISPIAISCLDGKYYSNGLVDRLRGMVSVYLYARVNNLDFRIEHDVPFKLSDFLIPNCYDWILKDNEKSNNIRYAGPICMFNYTKGKRIPFLKNKRQHHFYTNINLLNTYYRNLKNSYTFSGLYNELFKPSPLLENAIKKCKEEIGCDYITISFRFMRLLGDFKDAWGDELDEREQMFLLDKSVAVVQHLKEANADIQKIIVTSDSQKFIDSVRSFDYVYIIPGIIEHIGYSEENKNSSVKTHLKTFLDFYMISGAQKVYLGVSGKMYNSNYARTAAIIGNKPFEVIKY